MNKIEKITHQKLGDFYYEIYHDSGLKIIVYPKENFLTSSAMFATRFGSIDTAFKLSGETTVSKVPAGIAHFLEHKLFESEDGDAFAKYAKTGASANAFTSFDSTCYLFSATQNLYESLEILLNFVQSPFFTEKSIAKEQGIIGQEIKMYDDDPQWKVMTNLFKAMYHNHTIKEDIAGTVESISKITPDYLYSCYNTFYNLNNMTLVLTGAFELDKVIELCDKLLIPAKNSAIIRVFEKEPKEIVKDYIEEKLSVSSPMCLIGYKEDVTGLLCEKDIVATKILLHILASSSSELYKNLFDTQVINDATFDCDHIEGEGFSCVVFGGETKNPEKIIEEVKLQTSKMKKEGIPLEDFERAKKTIYGSIVAGLNNAYGIASVISSLSLKNKDFFKYVDSFNEVTVEDVISRLDKIFKDENTVLSVILPL